MIKASDLRIPFTWDERRPVLLDRCLYIPGVYDHEQWTPVPWAELFGNEQPVFVEYCSGNGQWIGERALQYPHLNWVAVEKRFERARMIWAKSHRESIPNLYVVCGEGRAFTRFYAPAGSVAEVFVNFPDPWPKRRHEKHRLVSAPFLRELLRIVEPGGKATCVTDDQPYASIMAGEFRKCPKWQSLLVAQQWPDYGRSFFSDLWMEKGRTIHYMSYERKQ